MLNPTADISDDDAHAGRRSRLYLVVLLGGFALLAAGLLTLGLRGRDHIGQIALNGDMRWYQNYGHVATREMQDRDVLFHGIGSSIDHLRKADIVILGHSVLEFAINSDMMDAFQAKHGVRIYNLNTPGIASGAFVRELIRKNRIRPKIWIINADDSPADFFNPTMDDYFASGRNSTFQIVKTSKLKGYLQVASRNLRWRIEQTIADHGPSWIRQPPYPFIPNAVLTWRNIETGNFNIDRANGYLPAAPIIRTKREDCPVTEQHIDWAREFVDAVGGTSVLTLVPYDGWCPERLPALADAVGLENFLPPNTDFEVFDGRHMNLNGSVAYTRYFLAALEQTRAFKILKGQPDPGPDPRSNTRAHPATPVSVCVSNTSSARLFVSLRYREEATDHIVGPGETLRGEGRAGGSLCSDSDSFNRNQCPNRRSPGASLCP